MLAPYWARMSDRHGRKALTLLGHRRVHRLDGVVRAGAGVRPRRGAVGDADDHPVRLRPRHSTARSARPPPARPRPISRRRPAARRASRRCRRSSSSFGLGTIVGPALAPLFVLPFVGLPGPLFAFALIALVVFVAILVWLPNDNHARHGARRGHGAAMSYPSIASSPTGASVVASTAAARRPAQVERPRASATGSSPGWCRGMPRRRC